MMVKYEPRPRRVSRVREAAARYAVDSRERIAAPSVYHLTVDERGRVMLPAELREKLQIAEGDRIALIFEDDGTMSLKTRDVAISNLRGMFKHLAPTDHFASDDLIAGRRREARKEEREFRERTALHRRMTRERARRPRRER
jgi:AbrB family looped-hinge helix DNA binding protein